MGGRGTSSGASKSSGTNRNISISGSGSFGSGMAGRGSGPIQFQMQQDPPHQAPTPQVAAQENNSVFKATDNSPYHDLYNGSKYYQDQNLTVSQAMAVMDYIDPTPTAGSMYAASQNLNNAMLTGKPLTAQQQYTAAMLNSAMHNLGYNLNLTRYDHSEYANGLLRGTGLDMDTASVAQLQGALVGKQFGENRFLSTSYNNFKNAPNGNPFTDRQVKIIYRAKAGVQAMMPGDTTNRAGQKLRWGEIIVSPNTPQKIVGVREVSARGARPKRTPAGTKGARQIELIIELG